MKKNDSISWVKQALDQQANNIEPETAEKLQTFRENLLTPHKKQTKKQRTFRWYASGAALASFALITFSLTIPQSSLQSTAIDDIDLLASNNDPNFYQDLEFYQWLEKEITDDKPDY